MNEIILEISAFAIALFCLTDCFRNRAGLYVPFSKGLTAKLRAQHFSYIMLLIMLLFSAASSVLEVSLESFVEFRSALVLYIINQIYFIFHTALPTLFCLYMINMTGAVKKTGKLFYSLLLTPLICIEAVILSNPLTGLIYYIDDTPLYVRGSLMWLVYVVALGYVVAGVTFLLLNVRSVSKLNRTATIILVFISVLGILIQAMFFIPVELFFEAIAFFGFMLLLEDEKFREKTGRNARMNSRFIVVIVLIFMAVVVININIIYSAGTEFTERIGQMQTESLKGELQQVLSESDSNVLRYSMNLDQLIRDGADISEIEQYINSQNDKYTELSGENCFSVYAACPEWTIIPGFDYPDDYIAVERVWYTGAAEHPGQVYVSEPYIDANTKNLCYTFSYMLSDGKTVAAMDYTLSEVQGIVERMGGSNKQFAVVVTGDGKIVGCSQENLQGEQLYEKLPEYKEIFDRVRASNEHRSFSVNMDDGKKIVFSHETTNGWSLILVADQSQFYSQIYSQMVMLGAVDLLMVMVIIVFFMVSVSNQRKAEISLSSTEGFIASLGGDLRDPLNDILRISDMYSGGDSSQPEAIRSINEAGKRLREKMDNLFSYSRMLRFDEGQDTAGIAKDESETFTSSRHMRNGIIGILIAALVIGLVICIAVTARWGESRIGREADSYNKEVSVWMTQKESILYMFTDVIGASPEIMEDYDKAVKWLEDIVRNYSEMNFAYMGAPDNKEHPVTMNNGWVPGDGFVLEQRQWYVGSMESKDGFALSSPYIDAQTGLYCITFSKTVYTPDGKFLGVFGIDCLLDRLIDVLDDSYTADSYAFMVDQNGIIINHPNKAYELSADNEVNVEDTPYAETYHNGSSFWLRDYDNRIIACRAVKSSLSGFTVIFVRSWWSIYGALFVMTGLFLLMIITSIIAVAGMIGRFIRWQEASNKKLVEAVDSAVAAEKAKSRFLAQMSHEIRTPINTVLGMNEMIIRESSDDGIKEYAANIRLAGRNLLGLINSILDFSKIEEGRMEIVPVRYDTASMIEGIINSISKRAEDKGLRFSADIDPDLPSAMYGDDMRISQIVTNLLTNAVKYTQKGSVNLIIKGSYTDEETIALSVSVKDTGIGIRQEDIGRLFESFTRLEEERNRNIEGTGLGMTIVNRLLDMMDSKLSVNSVYGEGSEFSFVLRQSVVDRTPLGNYEKHRHNLTGEPEDEADVYAPDAKILVVDDNRMNLTVMRSLLKLDGIVPDVAGSGQEALTKLEQGRYDIVMLDHMMPQMDGIETLKAAKEKDLIPGECVVIALTANAVVGAREEYMRQGFDDYLSKPVEVKALKDILLKHLPSSRLTDRKSADHSPTA
ncbi:MAG: response regulator [Lachnospiraceae bacterium]|nr:response regulator [Lachnospiraceae bacterium]